MSNLKLLIILVLSTHMTVVCAKQPLQSVPADPQILAMMKWKKQTPSLEATLKINGWWKSDKKKFSDTRIVLLENEKFSEPFTLLVKGRGIASQPSTRVIEFTAKHECSSFAKTSPGSVMHFKYHPKTEHASCWIELASKPKDHKEVHSFIIFKSVMKGAQAYASESAQISVDRIPKQQGAHPTAVLIAKQIGAL